jgi:hypothetical protein
MSRAGHQGGTVNSKEKVRHLAEALTQGKSTGDIDELCRELAGILIAEVASEIGVGGASSGGTGERVEHVLRMEADHFPSSVEIGRSAGGETTWAVKVYCSVGKENDAKKKTVELVRELEKEFLVCAPSATPPSPKKFWHEGLLTHVLMNCPYCGAPLENVMEADPPNTNAEEGKCFKCQVAVLAYDLETEA